jgi:ureidoglycolate lyase
MINNLKIEILNTDSFSPFGDILYKKSSSKKVRINQGTTTRHHNISELKLTDQNGIPAISIFSGSPRKIPIRIKTMEKHPIKYKGNFVFEYFFTCSNQK